MELDQLYSDATGYEPYEYQRRVAEEGLPELLRIPTGCGKTEAVGLGWLYRRRFHPDSAVRVATPHWLALALPMRTLVEQTVARIKGWFECLGVDRDIGLHVVQGGIGWSDRDWRLCPHREAVFVGTIDMLLSRALNRGYADGRWHWPMSFGGFNNGAHWVFDEVQLMDVATPNTRQLQSFRDTHSALRFQLQAPGCQPPSTNASYAQWIGPMSDPPSNSVITTALAHSVSGLMRSAP